MSHTYASILVHCVFSTKNREPLLTKEVRERVWSYMGGIARENNLKALAVGGYVDHAHLLLSLKPTDSVAKVMQEIKAGSSKFIHDEFRTLRGFNWQEGYGAFTIGISALEDTVNYIAGQEEHHRVKTFQEEYIAILKKHGIEYDERHVWG